MATENHQIVDPCVLSKKKYTPTNTSKFQMKKVMQQNLSPFYEKDISNHNLIQQRINVDTTKAMPTVLVMLSFFTKKSHLLGGKGTYSIPNTYNLKYKNIIGNTKIVPKTPFHTPPHITLLGRKEKTTSFKQIKLELDHIILLTKHQSSR